MGRGLSELEKMILRARYEATEIEGLEDQYWNVTKRKIWKRHYNVTYYFLRWDPGREYDYKFNRNAAPSVSRAISRLKHRGLLRIHPILFETISRIDGRGFKAG